MGEPNCIADAQNLGSWRGPQHSCKAEVLRLLLKEVGWLGLSGGFEKEKYQ